jgi:hypothetical protein
MLSTTVLVLTELFGSHPGGRLVELVNLSPRTVQPYAVYAATLTSAIASQRASDEPHCG